MKDHQERLDTLWLLKRSDIKWIGDMDIEPQHDLDTKNIKTLFINESRHLMWSVQTAPNDYYSEVPLLNADDPELVAALGLLSLAL